MKPTLSSVHIDRPLTNLAVNYKPQFMISDTIFPFFTVTKRSDKWWIFDRTRISGWEGSSPTGREGLRSESGLAKSLGGFSLSTSSYYVENYAYNDVLFREVNRNADEGLELRSNHTEQLTERLRLEREIRCAAIYDTSGNYGGTHAASAGAGQWSTISNIPSDDIITAQNSIVKLTLGNKPNLIVMSWEVFQALRKVTDVKERVKYSQAVHNRDITPAMIAAYFDVPNIAIGRVYYNSANEGATESLSPVWGDNVGLFYVEPPSRKYRGWAQTFTTRSGGFETRSWQDEPRKGEVIEVEAFADEVVINTGAGYLITDVLA